jgi:hypothetical protein
MQAKGSMRHIEARRIGVLLSVKKLCRQTVHARDGDLGRLRAIYFDDHSWAVRHVVVGVGGWLTYQRVLIAPSCIDVREDMPPKVRTSLTTAQALEKPAVATDPSVSDQRGLALYRYYGFPYDWSGPGRHEQPRWGNPHCRSTRKLIGYYVHTLDGEIGHIDDFLLDIGSWTIPYVVIETRNWFPGTRVLLFSGWISWVSWAETAIHVDLRREKIRSAPAFDQSCSVDRNYERLLNSHYGSPTTQE